MGGSLLTYIPLDVSGRRTLNGRDATAAGGHNSSIPLAFTSGAVRWLRGISGLVSLVRIIIIITINISALIINDTIITGRYLRGGSISPNLYTYTYIWFLWEPSFY